jgi:hypothetical protein
MVEEVKAEKKEEVVKTPAPEKTPEVKVEKEVETPTPEDFKPIEIPQEDWQVSPLFYEVASYFSIDPKEYQKSSEKLSLITEWAINEANSNKLHDILPIIRKLEDKIMKPAWGETRYGNLYRYLRLSVKRDAWNKALEAFEKMPKKK